MERHPQPMQSSRDFLSAFSSRIWASTLAFHGSLIRLQSTGVGALSVGRPLRVSLISARLISPTFRAAAMKGDRPNTLRSNQTRVGVPSAQPVSYTHLTLPTILRV